MTDAEVYWDNAYRERARLLFAQDGYDIPYTGAVKRAYEDYTEAQADVLTTDARRVKEVCRALRFATGGALGPKPTQSGHIFVGDFPPFQNPAMASALKPRVPVVKPIPPAYLYDM